MNVDLAQVTWFSIYHLSYMIFLSSNLFPFATPSLINYDFYLLSGTDNVSIVEMFFANHFLFLGLISFFIVSEIESTFSLKTFWGFSYVDPVFNM